MTDKIKYTLNDVGCYVDSARGIYAIDAIVEFADAHGFKGKIEDCEFETTYEIEDEATEFMNENYPVSEQVDTSTSEDEANLVEVTASWGRNEQGDWGLGLDD